MHDETRFANNSNFVTFHMDFYSLVLTSSTTSRIAASLESSPGSTPPEGTTHLPGWRQLETKRTYKEQIYTTILIPPSKNTSMCHDGVRPTSCSWSVLKQIQPALLV